jgi:hypothetical protein
MLTEVTAQMCHLLSDASIDVQKSSYRLLQNAARKRTEHLVVEVGVDTEDVVKAELPPQLVGILERDLHFDDLEYEEQVRKLKPLSIHNFDTLARMSSGICLGGWWPSISSRMQYVSLQPLPMQYI